jgi:hypothetical protein
MSYPNDAIQPWRDLVARLVSQNLELQRQLEELRKAKADSTVETLAASALHAVRAAEAALAEESTDGRRFVVGEMQTSFRGILLRQRESLALRLPLPEHAATPAHLGLLQMTFANVPTPPAIDAEAAVALAAALEKLQIAFAAWERGPGSAIARAIVDRLVALLAVRAGWDEPAFFRAMQAVAQMAVKFGAALRPLPAEAVRAYRNSARNWLRLAQSLASAQVVTVVDLNRLTLAVEEVTQSLKALSRGKRQRRA